MANKINIAGPTQGDAIQLFSGLGKCPVCGYEQFDGENCTACGFDADKYSVDGFKKELRRFERQCERTQSCPVCEKETYNGRKCSDCGFDARKYSKTRYQRIIRLKRKKAKEKDKPKNVHIRLFKKRDEDVKNEQLQRQREENFDRRAGFICTKIARDVVGEITEKAKEFNSEHHPMARWLLIKRAVEEIKEYL
jgi:hypothetical protein